MLTRLILFTILLLAPAGAWAQKVALVTSRNVSVYADVVNGIKDGAGQVSFDMYYTEDGDPVAAVNAKSYDAICVVGSGAKKIIAGINNKPIVFSMFLDASGDLSNRQKVSPNVTGVLLNIDTEKELQVAKKIFPGLSQIHLLYSNTSKKIYDEISNNGSGVTVKGQEAADSTKVPSAINGMGLKGGDVFWLLPDPGIYNTDSLAFLVNFSSDKRVPMVGFAPNIVKAGAVIGFTYDYKDIGHQTAAMLLKVVGGTSPQEIPVERPRKVGYALNMKTAQALGIKIPSQFTDEASEVFK